MWLILLTLFLLETNAVKLRGMYNLQRERAIENQVNKYFFEIYTNAVLTASLSDKFTNYSFYEYGCIPLRRGMVDKKYIGHSSNVCDTHRENINYYTNIFLKNRQDTSLLENNYGTEISQLDIDECLYFNIEKTEINTRILQALNQTFNDIQITNITRKCCIEYTIHW